MKEQAGLKKRTEIENKTKKKGIGKENMKKIKIKSRIKY